jgi:hypothetical protein
MPGFKHAPNDAGFEEKMALAGRIMHEDRETLKGLADADQMATAREVMKRRRKALRKLAE